MPAGYDIFFSYSHRDSGIARGYKNSFEKAGLTCFLAETDIPAGVPWSERVREAIRSSKRMVFLITPRSKDSLWIAAEAGAGWILEKELIAALMFVEANELIDPIRSCQARMVESMEQTEALIHELTSNTSKSKKREEATLEEVVTLMNRSTTREYREIERGYTFGVVRGIHVNPHSKKMGKNLDEGVTKGLPTRNYRGNPLVSLAGQWQEMDGPDASFFKQKGNRVVGFFNYGSKGGKVGVRLGTIHNGAFQYHWKWLNGQFQGHGCWTKWTDDNSIVGEWWFDENREENFEFGYHRISDTMPSWLTEADFEPYADFLNGKNQ